jgi:hypothetical protein
MKSMRSLVASGQRDAPTISFSSNRPYQLKEAESSASGDYAQ